MDKTEAADLVGAIDEHLESTLTLLLKLYRREGWKAVNYPNWDTFVTAEFGLSAAQIAACWQEMPERWKKDVNFQEE